MNREECLKEIMEYGYTFEQACKYHKAICKKQPIMLRDFRLDLQLKLDSEKAKEVYDRLTSSWEDCGFSPLHALGYSMISDTMRNLTPVEESAYEKCMDNLFQNIEDNGGW